ncbi:NGG1p interacting factor NIF3 [Candidiatus Paracoxiella cheracis]|uniref:NGG1p interacting factor NIF3 n=1 Tax=Candidiatus Paracoxiella cheracis TaxID=3405120 RepID=UPI003BF4BCB2
MHKISFYVPESHLDIVKNALFNKGAGKIGDYSHCAWQTKGFGQFKPLAGSQPHIGKQDNIETVEEYLVEMVCDDHYLNDALAELLDVHPYETPAYAAWEIKQYEG